MLRNVRFMIVLVLALGFVSFLIPSVSLACSCAELPSVEEQFARSEAVFSGKVIKINERKSFSRGMTKSVLFEVAETWKGSTESQIYITTGQGGGDCGINFIQGREYLVYAKDSSMYGADGELVTIMCDRTKEIVTAQEDLGILGDGELPAIQVDFEAKLGNLGKYLWGTGIVIAGVLIFLFAKGRQKS